MTPTLPPSHSRTLYKSGHTRKRWLQRSEKLKLVGQDFYFQTLNGTLLFGVSLVPPPAASTAGKGLLTSHVSGAGGNAWAQGVSGPGEMWSRATPQGVHPRRWVSQQRRTRRFVAETGRRWRGVPRKKINGLVIIEGWKDRNWEPKEEKSFWTVWQVETERKKWRAN